MTEQEWLACEDPARMVDFLQHWTQDDATDPNRPNPHPPSNRKLRLYDAARLRSVTGGGDGEALAVATRLEQRADGIDPGGDGMWDAGFMFSWLREAVCVQTILGSDQTLRREWTDLLRCVFGNPFRLVHIREPYQADDGWGVTDYRKPFWLTSNVLSVAQAIYDTRRFEDMPVLADALEEAGCTDAAVLNHCRGLEQCFKCLGTGSGGDNFSEAGIKITCLECRGRRWIPSAAPHARGCWVLDLLLGKE